MSDAKGILRAGTKYRTLENDDTLSEFFTLPVDREVAILALDGGSDPCSLNVYKEIETGTWMYVRNQDEVAQ